MGKVFLHVDLDAFFASVEQLDNPALKGKPVIVGGSDRRSVVSTASYEARKFGVHSAMPIFTAKKLCPNGIFLPVRMARYHEKSDEVMRIFENYSPDIQKLSIDEAFIDLTGTERLFGHPERNCEKAQGGSSCKNRADSFSWACFHKVCRENRIGNEQAGRISFY